LGEPTGTITDILRCSLNDGPGIRTTVFFKGCPLRCRWCHNPECISARPQLAFWQDRCTGCGACAEACPEGVHGVSADGHVIRRDLCALCGSCVAACPADALRITGKECTVQDVMGVVLRDADYYETSGGGVSVSGGEPLAQPRFLAALLGAARRAGVHTCVETSGHARGDVVDAILPETDLWLFDYKATDPGLHRELTGAGNELVLAALDRICRAGARVVLRCPLAPGVNDDAGHLAGIAALAARYPQVEHVELMAYHNTGNAKYARYGMQNPLPDLPTTGQETKAEWLRSLADAGCTVATVG
jgi:glycyl-radical enzyme activating protein